jgi:nitroreductase
MKQTDLYDVIFKRKAVRKYNFTPLDEKTLAGISAYISSIKPLNDKIKTEIKLFSEKDVKSLQSKAPHYAVVFSETKEGYLTNAGFMLQQVDLFLSANGIGCCWQGMPKLKKDVLGDSKLEFVIVLAFGKPAEPLHRKSISEFDRKPLEKITNITGANELLEPARLAPSGVNSQPWYFTGGKGIIHAYCVKSRFLKALIFKKMNRIDMGIALCHLWIAAKHFGKKIDFTSDQKAQNTAPKGYYYITSLKVK